MKTQHTPKTQQAPSIDGWFATQVSKFENARFFWMTIYLTAQSCLGSIAAGFILSNHANILILSSCAAITMASNAVFIAQGPGKVCLLTFYSSIILNSVFIILNI